MAAFEAAYIRGLVKERTHMQGFTYENQGQNTYLVYQFDDRPIDTMALGMLTNNKIKGFAPAIYTEIDNQKFIKYNVSSHVTLSKLFMGDVRKMRLLKTFVNIVDAMQMLDAYMLDRRTIMLDRDYIYVDASTSDVSMICVPVVDEFAPIDEREFFKNIIFSVSFAANENGDYVARILAYLNSVELFQLQDFKKMLEGLMSEQPAVGMQNVQPAMGAPYMQNNPYQQTPAGAPAQPQMNMKPAVMQQPVPPVQPQNRPTDIGQEPAIQNVYVSSGASAKDIKLAKREEMLKQQEEERAREMAKNPIAPENVDMGFAVPGMSTNQYASKPKAAAPAVPAKKASKGKKNSGSSEDDISLFYLMQHYSKENKEKYNITTYGIKNQSNFNAQNIILDQNGSEFICNINKKDEKIRVPVGGEHFVLNSLCAIAVGNCLSVKTTDIIEGIEGFELTKKRMDIKELKNGVKIINDAYNASFESMKATLNYLSKFNENRKIAVLGDMFELGDFSKELHEKVGNEVVKNNIDILICNGENSKYIISKAEEKGMKEENIYYFENREEILELLEKIAKKGDIILFKASNGMKFFELANKMEKKDF